VLATRAFVLNWNANPTLAGANSQNLQNEAESEALMRCKWTAGHAGNGAYMLKS
jgi:hypothetical protein